MKIILGFIAVSAFSNFALAAACDQAAKTQLATLGITTAAEVVAANDSRLVYAIETSALSAEVKAQLQSESSNSTNVNYLSNTHAGLWLVITDAKSCAVSATIQLQAI